MVVGVCAWFSVYICAYVSLCYCRYPIIWNKHDVDVHTLYYANESDSDGVCNFKIAHGCAWIHVYVNTGIHVCVHM